MKKVLNATTKLVGSSNSTEPRHIKEIIKEILQRDLLFKTVYPNTELGIDLKLLTLQPGRLELGDAISGILLRDGEYHFTLLQIASEAKVAEMLHASETDSSAGNESVVTKADVSVIAERVTPVASDKKAAPVKRNPIVIPGNCVNLHRKDDGSPYLTFRHPVLTEHYTWMNFCIEAANEILSLCGLVVKKSSKART